MALPADIDLNRLLRQLEHSLSAVQAPKDLYKAIVDAPFNHPVEMAFLFLGFICFYLISDTKQSLRFVSGSETEYLHLAIDSYDFDLSSYEVPLSETDNSLIKAVTSGKPVQTANWDSLRRPKIADGVARLNQATAGIGYSMIHPLAGERQGALMFSFYEEEESLDDQQREFMERYTGLISKELLTKKIG